MALVEGLDDAVGSEMDRIRDELRRALKESPYTYGEVASMAGVDVSNIYRFLSGKTSMITDNLVRVFLCAGARVGFSASGGQAAPPFQIVPSALRSASKGSSTSTTSSGTSLRGGRVANIEAKRDAKRRRTAADHQKRRTRKDDETHRYNEDVVYLQNYSRVVGL